MMNRTPMVTLNGLSLAKASTSPGREIPRLSELPMLRKRQFAVALDEISPASGFHVGIDAARQAGIPLFIAGEVTDWTAHGEYWKRELLPRLDRSRRWIGVIEGGRRRRLLTGARCLLAPGTEADVATCLEALAGGTAVIGWAGGPLSHIVDHGATGFLVRNTAEMAEAIRGAHLIDRVKCVQSARAHCWLDRLVSSPRPIEDALVGPELRVVSDD